MRGQKLDGVWIPQPGTPHPKPLMEITEKFHATKCVQNLIIVCSNDVIYKYQNILKVLSKLKKWLGRKLTFITVKGYETLYGKWIWKPAWIRNTAAINDGLLIKTFILILALSPSASSQGSGDSAHSRQFPNPQTSHGHYSIVLCDNVYIITFVPTKFHATFNGSLHENLI